MKESLRRIALLAGRNLKEILREPISLVFMMGLPLLMEILFFFIFHDLTAQFEMRYLAPGIVVFSQSFLTLFTGLLLSLDRASSFLTRLYVSRARSYDFILGYALALLPVALVQSAVFFLAGGCIDASLFGAGMFYGVLLSMVSALFFIGAGILLGSVCNEKAMGGVASVFITGQSVLSGMWFPLTGIADGVLVAMRCLPFKNATDMVQNALVGIGDPLSDLVYPLLIVLAYTVVIYVAAVLAFRRKMKA